MPVAVVAYMQSRLGPMLQGCRWRAIFAVAGAHLCFEESIMERKNACSTLALFLLEKLVLTGA